MSDPRSAFHWTTGESEIAKHFRATKAGKTHSQVSSEMVSRYIAQHGRSPGTVDGLSSQADRLINAHRARNVNRKAAA